MRETPVGAYRTGGIWVADYFSGCDRSVSSKHFALLVCSPSHASAGPLTANVNPEVPLDLMTDHWDRHRIPDHPHWVSLSRDYSDLLSNSLLR